MTHLILYSDIFMCTVSDTPHAQKVMSSNLKGVEANQASTAKHQLLPRVSSK